MCKIINFSEYKGLMAAKRVNPAGRTQKAGGSIKAHKFVTAEWMKEYLQKGWSVSKLIAHVIEQYGYICCGGGRKKYVFEEVKRDVKYYEMYPEIEEKHFKAPLWVKVNGEWYFVEVYTDSASLEAFQNKWREVGNYDVKGFAVDLYGLNKRKIKQMLEENDVTGAVKEICSIYKEGIHDVMGDSECKASVSFGSETAKRDCTYRLVELKPYRYAIVEGTELKDGSKHMVLLYDAVEKKESVEYFREQYKNAGMPLLYGQWHTLADDWKSCISNKKKLYKRLVSSN